MRFKNTNLNTGRTFSCKMKKVVCGAKTNTGRPCRNKVVIGLKSCHMHRKVKIAQSTIPRAGKGVFAKRDYKVGQRIGYYRGDVLSTNAHNQRYGSGKRDHAPYSLQGSKSKIIDAECTRSTMSMINGTRLKKDANAVFGGRMQSKATGKMPVKAFRSIKKGDEVFVHYGASYFRTAENARHSTR